MSKRTPKNHKNSHNTHVVLCWRLNFFESNKRQRISFRPQRWHVPYRNHHACCEKLWFMRRLYPNLPQMGQKSYHVMLMPLHDRMPSFMNFGRILDLLELRKQVRRCLPAPRCRGVQISSPFLAIGYKHKPMDTYMILQPMLVHRSMCMSFNFWIMHLKWLENQFNV